MTLYKWSQTANSNANSDSTINWAEGMPPSAVNDSSRAEMAAVAKYRDDNSGILNTAGSSTAITITSNQVTTVLLDGFSITARITTTNGAAPTLNVDATGAKAIRVRTSTAVPTGAMLAGSMHKFTYDSADDCWYAACFFAVTTLAGGSLDIVGTTALTAPAIDDLALLYDLSATANRSITLANLFNVMNLFTEDTAPDEAADFLLSYDTSAGSVKKVKPQSIQAILTPSVNKLVVTNNGVSNTQVTITADAAVLVDTNNFAVRVSSVSLTINAATTGANALDAGSLAADTEYHFWIINNGTTTAGLVSTSSTAPTMPGGYTYKYRVGAIRTVVGSASFHRFRQMGNSTQYVPTSGSVTTVFPVMLGAGAGSFPVTIPLAQFVPSTATRIRGVIVVGSTSGSGAIASNNFVAQLTFQTGTTNTQVGTFFDIAIESTNVFGGTGNSSNITCTGWVDSVSAS
jgi:hypothetical protein